MYKQSVKIVCLCQNIATYYCKGTDSHCGHSYPFMCQNSQCINNFNKSNCKSFTSKQEFLNSINYLNEISHTKEQLKKQLKQCVAKFSKTIEKLYNEIFVLQNISNNAVNALQVIRRIRQGFNQNLNVQQIQQIVNQKRRMQSSKDQRNNDQKKVYQQFQKQISKRSYQIISKLKSDENDYVKKIIEITYQQVKSKFDNYSQDQKDHMVQTEFKNFFINYNSNPTSNLVPDGRDQIIIKWPQKRKRIIKQKNKPTKIKF